jgi:NADH-quinone oxidoreductase subunit N
VAAGVQSALWLLVIILVVNSAIGLFYYLRVIAVMYMQLSEHDEISVPVSSLALAGSVVLVVLALLLVWLGVYPSPVIDMIQKTIGGAI